MERAIKINTAVEQLKEISKKMHHIFEIASMNEVNSKKPFPDFRFQIKDILSAGNSVMVYLTATITNLCFETLC